MDKDLHDIDDFFRSELEGNEESPSACVKESLLALLDKRDAETYKRRSSRWKRAALIMFFFLVGFIIYESGVWINDSRDSGQRELSKGVLINDPARDSDDDHATPGNSNTNKKAEINQKENNIISGSGDVGKETPDSIAAAKDKNLNHNIINLEPAKKEQKFPGQNNLITGKRVKSKIRPSIANNNKNRLRFSSDKNSSNKNGERALSSNPVLHYKTESRLFASLPAFTIPRADQGPKEFKMSGNMDSIINSSLVNTSAKRIHHFKPYWTITGMGTYDRVNYKLDSDLPSNITSISHREIHEPSFSVGLLATRQIKQHWGLQTGFIYSNNAIGISAQKIYALQDPAGDIAYKYITSSGYAYIKPGFGPPPSFGDSINSTEAKHSLHSVGIPLIIKHTIGKNKFLLIPGVGLEANFITRAKLTTEIEDASNRETVFINKLNGAKSFYWSFTADTELRYLVNKKIAFSLRPVFRYALSAITDNNVVETIPYSIGAGLGLTYQF
ncbi:MAG: hypothetical protein ACSLE0_01350 [Chitinophagaceae bacterium]